MTRVLAVVSGAMALAACGGGGGGGAAGGTAGGWKATDACAIMTKETVARTLGGTVTSAELQAVHDGSAGNGDLYSQCTFNLADGRLLVFGTAQAPGDPDVAATVASLRGQAAIVTDEQPVDLPGVGRAALWLPRMNALYVVLGDGRWASATLGRIAKPVVTSEEAQRDGIKLMRTVGA